jgi:hypothetical protein
VRTKTVDLSLYKLLCYSCLAKNIEDPFPIEVSLELVFGTIPLIHLVQTHISVGDNQKISGNCFMLRKEFEVSQESRENTAVSCC